MGVGVGRAEGDAVLHALAQAHGKGVEVGEGDIVLVVVKKPFGTLVPKRPGASTMSSRVPFEPL